MKETRESKKIEETDKISNAVGCIDALCPVHGSLKTRGRTLKGYVTKKFPKRIVIEFERIVYIQKYERYMKKKTRIHARLPDCMKNEINIGDYIEVQECRPLSKIMHFVVIKKLRRMQFQDAQKSGDMKISDIKKIRGGRI